MRERVRARECETVRVSVRERESEREGGRERVREREKKRVSERERERERRSESVTREGISLSTFRCQNDDGQYARLVTLG